MTANEALVNSFLTPIVSAQHMRDWVFNYLEIDFPLGHIDPDSNSSPVEWMWEAYRTYKSNEGNKRPGYIVLSSRDSYKTLSESVLNVLLMIHFKTTISHLAAIESQASKAIQYVSMCLRKLKPYLDAHGIISDTQSKRKHSIMHPDGKEAYVNVIIATVQGCNSSHDNILSVDELDILRFPQAYEEAKMIPCVMGGRFPITFKVSTRKNAFSLMQKEIDNAKVSGDTILRWNIIDVTERCPESRCRPGEPKIFRYVGKNLPLINYSRDDFELVPVEVRDKYDEVEAYSGCASCPILAACRTRLADRPKEDVGGLYKPIEHTINLFKKLTPDMAEAQLLCWRPSLHGLIYPRFLETGIDANTLSVAQAWKSFTGNEAPTGTTLLKLINMLHYHGVQFTAGVDWGFRHAFAVVIGCELPDGAWWIVEVRVVKGLELDEMVSICSEVRDLYKIKKWYADTAMPSYIKTFRRKGMMCLKFKKDIDAGIEAVRGKIMDAMGRRYLRVIESDQNSFLIDGFRKHHFKLDAAGNPTREPDDEEFADVMDALRYLAQNLFKPAGRMMASNAPMTYENEQVPQQNQVYSTFFHEKINTLTKDNGFGTKGKSSSGSLFFDFTDPTLNDEEKS